MFGPLTIEDLLGIGVVRGDPPERRIHRQAVGNGQLEACHDLRSVLLVQRGHGLGDRNRFGVVVPRNVRELDAGHEHVRL